MTISVTLEEFLNRHDAQYDLIPHPHTGSSMETAEQAHVPGQRLAKAVILKEEGRYLMVVVPSVEHVDMAALRAQFGHGVELATEEELAQLFPDCAVGAIPPAGPAWGMETYLDECLLDEPEVFFEAGDHEELVRIDGESFQQLLKEARRGHYGHTL
jgi:Ala-tRNA(Pro) deacylase